MTTLARRSSPRFDIYPNIALTLAASAALVAVIATGVPPTALAPTAAAFAVLGLVHGLAIPSRDGLVAEFSTAGSTGQSFGLAYTGVTVGAFIAPGLLGFVSDPADNQVMFGLIGAFYLAAVVTVLLVYAGFVRGGPADTTG